MANISDDILCFGANEQEHNLGVIKVDMHLNLRKVKFKSPEPPFFRNMLTIPELQSFLDKRQLQSFLKSVNYLSPFIAGLSEFYKPLLLQVQTLHLFGYKPIQKHSSG